MILDGQVAEFDRWEDLPERFDHLVRFLPQIPPPPHTPEQHADAEAWVGRLRAAMERENASGDKDRRR